MDPTKYDQAVMDACSDLDVDWDHSRHVADLCDQFYDQAKHLHGLTKTHAPLLRAAAMLHDICAAEDKERHHLEAADAVKRLDVPGLSDYQRNVLAEAIKLHPGRVDVSSFVHRADDDTALEHEIAGRIAAVLRIADGLDRSRSHESKLMGLMETGSEIEAIVSGGNGLAEDIKAAGDKADLWNGVMYRPIRLVKALTADQVIPPLIQPGDTLAGAAAKIMLRQFEKFRCRLYGLPYDHDVEFVHETRVATRRMRTALRMVRKKMGNQGQQWNDELKWVANALGRVRDDDVLLIWLEQYVGALDEEPPAVRELIGSIRTERQTHFRSMLAELDSERFEQFLEHFDKALTTPPGNEGGMQFEKSGPLEPLWQQGPKILHKRLDKVMKRSGKLKKMSGKELHKLRIACKRTRYTGEFLRELYPSELEDLTDAMENMQDDLGEVHDVDVWTDRIEGHLANLPSAPSPEEPGIADLLQKLQDRREEYLTSACKTWDKFTDKQLDDARDLIDTPNRP
ncbi:MAG: CHAD domain-containing protein [Phycisphaerae bacterium]